MAVRLYVLVVLTSGIINQVIAQNTGQGISLSLNPPSGKVTVGYDATFTCSLDVTIIGDVAIVWSRTTGSLSTTIAIGTRKEDEFVSQHRYIITKRGMANHKVSYMLTVSDVQLEDAGTFRCSVMGSSRSDSKALAVCVDPESKSCSCILTTGWASPTCFGESKSNEDLKASYDKTITGIGVCFAIAVIYGVIITVMFSRDCMRILHQKQKRRELRLQMQSHGKAPNPYAESEKLTLDPNDDNASVPESGVWSQSEGSSNRNSGRQNNTRGTQDDVGNITRNRPRPHPVAHVNAAFNPDDVDGSIIEKPPRRDPKQVTSGAVPKISGGGDLGISSPFSGSAPPAHDGASYPVTSNRPSPTAPYHDRPGTQGVPNGHYSGARPRTPPERPRLPPGLAPPAGTQSEGRTQSPERYPVDSREAYTDVRDQGFRGDRRNFAEPRRLDFIPKTSSRPRVTGSYGDDGGPYIDNHDTEI